MNHTISTEYLEMQKELHLNPNYGISSLLLAPRVAGLMRATGVKTLTDYGAGKRKLLEGLTQQGQIPDSYWPYDPAFPEYGPAKAADLVCCIDVLEHIEPEYLDAVIQDLRRITVKHGFFSVNTGPAKKVLKDGRNAHLIQQPGSWWLSKLLPYFEILLLEVSDLVGPDLWMLVAPKSHQDHDHA